MQNKVIRDFSPTPSNTFNLIFINEIDDKLYLANNLIIKPIIYKFNILDSSQEIYKVYDYKFSQLVYST
jgi:hypothetical protein